jgi:hypothetical protein
MKDHADLVPAGETVRGVIIAEGKGGSWRRGLRAASALGSVIADARASKQGADDAPGGAAGEMPESPAFWLVLTDKALHAFEGRVGSSKVGPAAAHYSFDRIASAKYDKKLTISKLEIAFTDGSAMELDVAKQKVKPFIEGLESRFSPA